MNRRTLEKITAVLFVLALLLLTFTVGYWRGLAWAANRPSWQLCSNPATHTQGFIRTKDGNCPKGQVRE